MLSTLFHWLPRRRPDKDAFARHFMRAARRTGIPLSLQYNRALFRIELEKGGHVNLHNAYRQYLSSPRHLQEEVVARHLAWLAGDHEVHNPLQAARNELRPVLRNASLLDQTKLAAAEKADWQEDASFQYRRVSAECVVLLGVDSEEHTLIKPEGPDASWGIDLEHALAVARGNLREQPDLPFEQAADGVFKAAWSDGYNSSRALLPDMLHRIPLRGLPVFMIPTRDLLLVAGDRDLHAQATLFRLAEEGMQDGYAVSWELFHYVDGEMQPVEPATPQLRLLQRRLRLQFEDDTYAVQQELLEHLHQLKGHQIFVASYGVNMKAERSFCYWAEGVEVSLPKTDCIVLAALDTDTEPMMVEWEAAMPVIGHLLEQDHRHIHPPRYRAYECPNRELRAQLTPVSFD
jgi:hypothetical protein